jgi:hypothetical protein
MNATILLVLPRPVETNLSSGYYNNYGVTTFDPGDGKKTFSIVNIGASVSKALKIISHKFLN